MARGTRAPLPEGEGEEEGEAEGVGGAKDLRSQGAKELRARSNECGVWGEVHHGFVYLVSTVYSLSIFELPTSMTF